MANPRLSLALDRGAITLPETGRIAVFDPRADYDLGPLPRECVAVVQTFRPDHDHFASQGYEVVTSPAERYAAALVVVARAKDAARLRIAHARAATDGPLFVDGQKTDGVDGLLREIRARAEVGEVLAKAHGKVFTVTGGDFADWKAAPRMAGGFRIAPGLFSADGPDPGSQALVRALPGKLPAQVADLGAGWGYLSHAVLGREGIEGLHLVEAELAALDCARANVDDRRAVFHWADATRFHPPAPLDAVVMNPPFHHGRRPDPSLGRAFIRAAAGVLKPAGQLWMVANRHLPYEEALRDAFLDVREVDDGAFKIVHAARPRRSTRQGRPR